jgi:hypothetical protein
MATKGIFRLTLMDVEGDFLDETSTEIAFFRAQDNQQLGDIKRVDFSQGPVNFSLQAFPAGPYICQITPLRYRLLKSGIFSLTAGQVVSVQQNVPRDPGRWRAQFVSWAALDGTFEPLRTVLTKSADLALFEGGSKLGTLSGDMYDAVSTGSAAIAKTSMLNLYYKLSTVREPMSGNSFLSYVRHFIAIGRERIIAVAEKELADAIRNIRQKLDDFREWHVAEDAEGHRGNVPIQFRSKVTEMISIKQSIPEASMQLTVAIIPGTDFVVFDADIDEHGELLHHGFDWVSHWFTGGTHPYDVHEFLMQESREAQKTVNLGYTLITV